MKTAAAAIEEYLALLPQERREALAAVRRIILENLPAGYVECFLCGMIAYAIPLARFPDTYNGQPLMIASLGAQKNHMVVHLMCIYGNTSLRQWFEEAYKKSGKKFDAGKACVRFKSLDDLPVSLIGQAIARVPAEKLMEWHNQAQSQRPRKRPVKKHARPAKKA